MQKNTGHWEVVGKKKDKAGKIQQPQQLKPGQNPKGKASVTKVEDVLPMSQVKSLFKAGKANNKENQVPKEKMNGDGAAKKQPPKKEKQNEAPKPKPPKSIESALNAVVIDEFKQLYERCRNQFPDTPVVLLKELSQFFNQRLTLDVSDNTFKNKPDGYPLCAVPSALKDIISKSIKEAGKTNTALFFDISLTAMATDMGKGLPALGHKIFLQYLAANDPKIVTNSLSKVNTLRTSYQNRPPIGLSILWVLAQAGLKDSQVALKVFEEVMHPLIEMKNYSRYITEYIITTLGCHSAASLTKDQYFLLLDVVCGDKKHTPQDLSKQLIAQGATLNVRLLESSGAGKLHLIFESLLKKIGASASKHYLECLCELLASCLQRDEKCFTVWSKVFVKCVMESCVVLEYLRRNWEKVGNGIDKMGFSEFLSVVEEANGEQLKKKKKDAGALKIAQLVKELQEIMVSSKKQEKTSTFSIIFEYTFLLVILLFIFNVYLDFAYRGWEASMCRRAATYIGMQEKADAAFKAAQEEVFNIVTDVCKQYPELTKAVEPYYYLVRDLNAVFLNLMERSYAIAAAKVADLQGLVELYAPGFLEKTGKALNEIWATSVLYCERGVDYLKKDVFVGKLSPENIRKVIMDVFNASQQKAEEYYQLVYKKIQTIFM